MPKLKQLPTNAYETLCAELASATATPFGAWCALDGRDRVGYASSADFAQEASGLRAQAKAHIDEGYPEADVAVLNDVASYLELRARKKGPSWLVEAGEEDAELKTLRDPHAIGLLFLDHEQDHATPQLKHRVAELLAQYAILEAEGRRQGRPGVPRTIWGFTPIEKNRSFASTGAKIGQLMGYLGYSEKDAELPLAEATHSIPSVPKQEGNSSAKLVQSGAKRALFLAVEDNLSILRASATLKDPSVEPVAWRWGFAQGNRTDSRRRLGLLNGDHAKWLASGRALALWFSQSCKDISAAADLAEEAQTIARDVAGQCAQDGREKDAEALTSHTSALMRRWAATQGVRASVVEQDARVVDELLAPLFAAVLCCVARHDLATCGFDASLVEVGVGTIPAASDFEQPETPATMHRAEYVTLRVSRIPTAERGSGRAQDVESRAFELGATVRIGRAPSYAELGGGASSAGSPGSLGSRGALSGAAAPGGTGSHKVIPAGTGQAAPLSGPVADLALGDPAISRLALVLHTEDALELEVLNENTYLRGKRLERGGLATLEPGDAIMVLGKSFDFVIEVAQLG